MLLEDHSCLTVKVQFADCNWKRQFAALSTECYALLYQRCYGDFNVKPQSWNTKGSANSVRWTKTKIAAEHLTSMGGLAELDFTCGSHRLGRAVGLVTGPWLRHTAHLKGAVKLSLCVLGWFWRPSIHCSAVWSSVHNYRHCLAASNTSSRARSRAEPGAFDP